MVRYALLRETLTSLRQHVLRNLKSEVEGYARHGHERKIKRVNVCDGMNLAKFLQNFLDLLLLQRSNL